eukprot:CAMPEP_0117573084 /NCGR_PEP_ID=MMETSP0784-20121206/60741_1 /TAXON_ID=39447 /ORGANISM="" /LENGTH=103 /DNA_ID=CAMNT_0005371577 /DNA_START=243 /DNA_END=551 /DNA_ORIENTATION=+
MGNVLYLSVEPCDAAAKACPGAARISAAAGCRACGPGIAGPSLKRPSARCDGSVGGDHVGCRTLLGLQAQDLHFQHLGFQPQRGFVCEGVPSAERRQRQARDE